MMIRLAPVCAGASEVAMKTFTRRAGAYKTQILSLSPEIIEAAKRAAAEANTSLSAWIELLIEKNLKTLGSDTSKS